MILASLPRTLQRASQGGHKKEWPFQYALFQSVVWLYRAYLHAKRVSNRVFHLRLSEVAKRAGQPAGGTGEFDESTIGPQRHFQAYFLCFRALSPYAQFITFTLFSTTPKNTYLSGNVSLDALEPSFTPVGLARLMALPNAHFCPLKKG